MSEVQFAILTLYSAGFAYIDPGSGSAIISAIVGVFVAAGLAIKTYWYKIVGVFSKKKTNDEAESMSDE